MTFSKSKVSSMQWTEDSRFQPQSSDELVVHRNKVQQIREALLNHRVRLLILSGPSGCGKTTALKIVAKELLLPVVEWTDTSIKNEWTALSQFLHDVKHYPILSKSNSTSQKQVVLLRDLPPIHQGTSWLPAHQLFCQWLSDDNNLSFHQSVLVLILTDLFPGQSHLRHIVTEKIGCLPSVCAIRFNPLATTFVKKALNQLLQLLDSQGSVRKKRRFDVSLVDQIVQGAQGDLKSAINTLQFIRYSHDNSKIAALSLGRVPVASLFHILGKILYGKEISAPEDWIAAAHLNVDRVNLYLNANYLNFGVHWQRAAESFVDADLLGKELWRYEVLSQYVATLPARTLLLKDESLSTSTSFRPFRQPVYFTLESELLQKREALLYQIRQKALKQKYFQNLTLYVTELLGWSNRFATFRGSLEDSFTANCPMDVEEEN